MTRYLYMDAKLMLQSIINELLPLIMMKLLAPISGTGAEWREKKPPKMEAPERNQKNQ